jgi:AcrR family transcriptional regulator
MSLILPPRFGFAEFKRVTPIDASNVMQLVVDRNVERITVKRQAALFENLAKIFDATFRIANKVGFVSMTLRDLCSETGLSMGGLYGYIESKDDLAEMIEDVIRYVGAAIPTWFESQPTAVDRLDATLRGHIFLSELLQPWFYFVFMESKTLSTKQKTVAKSSELSLQQALARLIVEARVNDVERASLMASHLIALIQDWHVKRWKYRQKKITVDEFADSVSAFALR